MTKLMFLAFGDPAALLGEPLRTGLATAGATKVQVNVSDEAVQEGMRLQVYAAPVTALVSVWTDAPASEAAPISDLLRDATETVVGWEVAEREPIPPLAVPDGERLDAMANFALLRIPEGLSREDWLHIWLELHTPIGIATQGTFGYVQNVVGEAVVDTTDGATRHPDALVEEHFPMAALTDIHAFYGSGGDHDELGRRMRTMMDSVGRFGADQDIDLVPTSRFVWTLSPGW